MKKVLRLKLLILSLTPFLLKGQEWTSERVVTLDQAPSAYSIDTDATIYLGFPSGRLEKYTHTGELSPVYSSPNQSAITLIEAQNNRKVFLFYRDIQQITILDRFSALPKNYSLIDLDVYFATMACPAPDGTFWAIENNPPRLKKIDPLRKATLLEVQHSLNDSVFFMRAFQNIVLVATASGITLFDQFGSFASSMDIGKTTYIQIFQNQFVANTAHGLVFFDPSQPDGKQNVVKPAKAAQSLFIDSNRKVVVGKKKLTYFVKAQD